MRGRRYVGAWGCRGTINPIVLLSRHGCNTTACTEGPANCPYVAIGRWLRVPRRVLTPRVLRSSMRGALRALFEPHKTRKTPTRPSPFLGFGKPGKPRRRRAICAP